MSGLFYSQIDKTLIAEYLFYKYTVPLLFVNITDIYDTSHGCTWRFKIPQTQKFILKYFFHC